MAFTADFQISGARIGYEVEDDFCLTSKYPHRIGCTHTSVNILINVYLTDTRPGNPPLF